VFAIAGIGGSLGAAALPARVPRSLALLAALCVLVPGLFLLYVPPSLAGFVFGCAAGGFYWNFTLSLQLGILSKADPSGRGAVLGGMVSGVGSALGPMLAGLLVQGSNFRPVGWLAAALVLAATACILIVNRPTTAPSLGALGA
jgi:predicted MFS family arabinose efflux permease